VVLIVLAPMCLPSWATRPALRTPHLAEQPILVRLAWWGSLVALAVVSAGHRRAGLDANASSTVETVQKGQRILKSAGGVRNGRRVLLERYDRRAVPTNADAHPGNFGRRYVN
jgi:hypothetical protein